MTDDEASFLFPIFAQRARLKPERSNAVESWKYNRGADHRANFGKREVIVDRLSDREIADNLLIEWYRWSKSWRPHLGAPRIAPYAKDYRQDEKHNEESDDYSAVHRKEMQAVAFCMSAIEVGMQQAIGTEMRNREVKQRVWRDRSNQTFDVALNAVYPKMRKHPDLCALFN